jgi:YebC/PmpR family DNA-binding regulatory protein
MAGHSKWANIKHKKGAADARRGKVFTKHAKLITLAAQSGGGDPETNPTLRAAIDKSRADNVPNNNIERAIKRGTGELKDAAQIEELTYEGYGPEGVAIIIECLSDNKNRTYANVRAIMTKGGGSIGETGCVGYMFKKKGVIRIEVGDEQKQEDIELKAIDVGAEDIETDDSIVEITTTVDNFQQVEKTLLESFRLLSSELEMVPDNVVTIEDVDKAKRILQLIDNLNEDEDVSNVYANFDIPDNVLATISQ